jgi:hypothetical protein
MRESLGYQPTARKMPVFQQTTNQLVANSLHPKIVRIRYTACMDAGSREKFHPLYGPLKCQVAIANAESDVRIVAFDSDGGFVVIDKGEDMNICILAGMERFTEQIP